MKEVLFSCSTKPVSLTEFQSENKCFYKEYVHKNQPGPKYSITDFYSKLNITQQLISESKRKSTYLTSRKVRRIFRKNLIGICYL